MPDPLPLSLITLLPLALYLPEQWRTFGAIALPSQGCRKPVGAPVSATQCPLSLPRGSGITRLLIRSSDPSPTLDGELCR
ncbi:MAG TPA: hypothetical protein VK053_00400, partial [Jiangellaceae bacterium]|nr:hypothetical protein [Jiangellaceae bacterium]